MKIYLIGMPGSGKTTLGKKLAEELAMPFVDLDKEIELQEGKSIAEIFLKQGEDYFRQVENVLLRQWAASTEKFVMATGGGAPCFYDGIKTINQTGLSIFLDTPVNELIKRVQGNTKRPLLNTDNVEGQKNKLTALRANRLKFYEQAQIKVIAPDFDKLLKAIQINR